jgi:hypothetical protein
MNLLNILVLIQDAYLLIFKKNPIIWIPIPLVVIKLAVNKIFFKLYSKIKNILALMVVVLLSVLPTIKELSNVLLIWLNFVILIILLVNVIKNVNTGEFVYLIINVYVVPWTKIKPNVLDLDLKLMTLWMILILIRILNLIRILI